jgi:O-methyltransferase
VNVIRRALRRMGYDVVRRNPRETSAQAAGFPPDFDEQTIALFREVQPYTMTSKERVLALQQSVEYVVRNEIPGAFVECGVWKGGSAMAMARTLRMLGAADRTLYLYDTFTGMTPPTSDDRAYTGESAYAFLEDAKRRQSPIWQSSTLDEVKRAIASTGYDSSKTVLVPGRVEDTIPAVAPDAIALLRLDTDWYASTYHELQHLYPRLSVGGVMIIDDYGHWQGARKAVDQYIEEQKLKLLLCRIDYTGRICVKLET